MILIGKRKVEFGQFPNMEMNLNYNKIMFSHDSIVTLKYETDQDLMNLYILKKYMDERMGYNKIALHILYMPYSRMDRRNNTYTFNLKYICEFINSMNFYEVFIGDVHSDVTPALINNYSPVSNISTLFKQFYNERGNMEGCYIMYPDAGAEKRYTDSFRYPTLVGSKNRDFATGNITSFKVLGDFKKNCDVVIIDDLCSKGGTFIGAAKALKEMGAKNVYLIVGHCEKTIFEGEIFETDLITKVYTTNSILPTKHTEKDYAIAEHQVHKNRLYIYELYEITK